MSMMPTPAVHEPKGPRPDRFTVGRLGLYVFLAIAAAFFLLPLYVMFATSLKSMDQIRDGALLALPVAASFDAWFQAWASACTGMTCNGLQPGFLNSIFILVPSVLLAACTGALTGYVLSFWRVPGANIVFASLLIGGFIPVQVFLYPLVRMAGATGINGSLAGVILMHVVFNLPVTTLIFRNYFSSLPLELFKAARVDGAGFFRTFFSVILPLSTPIIIVVVILLVTGIWNDFILGLVFAGREHQPMTVQLNNIVGSDSGARKYNVEMAAVLITTLLPLAVYFLSGRWFVRGIAAGAVKG